MRARFLATAWLVAATRLAAITETDQLPFRLFDRGAIVVPVSVEGHAPRPFLLDTGASRSAIAAAVAGRMGLQSVGSANVASALGQHRIGLVRLPRATFGGATSAFDLTALVVPGAQLGWRAPVDGLIGQDVLATRAFTIDYRRRALTWLDPRQPPPAGRPRLALTFEGGATIVTLPQTEAGVGPLRLVPDTGADGLVLFSASAAARLDFTPGDRVWLRTIAGERLARRGLIDGLDVGDVRLHATPARIVDGPGGTPSARVDGLLPLHLFSAVTFNGPAGYVTVTR